MAWVLLIIVSIITGLVFYYPNTGFIMNQRGDIMSLSRKLGMKRSKRFHNILYHVLVCLFGFLMIYPLLWMVMSSFKESSSIFRESYRLIPDTIHFENYINGWKGFGGYTFGVFF